MTYWWDKKAADLQRGVIRDEWRSETDLGEENAQRATIHARQDLILITSLLSSLNEQISYVVVLLILILIVLAAAVARAVFHWF